MDGVLSDIVSIHAPAWGATRHLVDHLAAYGPFQSTRPRGARHFAGDALDSSRRFNPRARVGRDAGYPQQ